MKILSADFLRAAAAKKDYPKGGLPELAFAGRSNVGKSSMINTLLGRRGLVRTSRTPGQTRALNFYLVNNRFIFVDLPGYGFAKAPEAVRARWGPMVENYLRDREQLAAVVMIVDARRGLAESDRTLMEFLKFHDIRFVLAATKADKLPRTKLMRQKALLEKQADGDAPVLVFSSHNGQGKKELWNEIKNHIERGLSNS